MMNWDDVRKLAATLPEVAEGASYGAPALKVGRGLLVRLREEDASLVLLDVPPEERALLIGREPEIYHLTPHYENYAIVLARMAAITPDRLFPFLERRWRGLAPKRALKARAAD